MIFAVAYSRGARIAHCMRHIDSVRPGVSDSNPLVAYFVYRYNHAVTQYFPIYRVMTTAQKQIQTII